jgi:ATP-dependent Clp protease ATP-binding subunit ClpA
MKHTPRTDRLLNRAAELAAAAGYEHVGTEHILLAILADEDGIAYRALVDPAQVAANVAAYMAEPAYSTTSTKRYYEGNEVPDDWTPPSN